MVKQILKILLFSTAHQPAQVLPPGLQADQGHPVQPGGRERVRDRHRVSSPKLKKVGEIWSVQFPLLLQGEVLLQHRLQEPVHGGDRGGLRGEV